MKNSLFTIALIFLFCLVAHAQQAQATCPPEMVCLSRAEAIKALQAVDERDAGREVIAAFQKKAEIDERYIGRLKELNDTYERLAASKDAEIKALREREAILTKKSQRKISFLWGLIKVRY